MSLNKKVLAAAIVGALMIGGSAVAAPLTVTKQVYAKEIVFPSTGLVPASAPSLVWKSGYNYSAGEVKYVRVELTGAKFGTAVAAPIVVNGTPGAINGMGTNVITFSVTSAPAAPFILSTSDITLPLAGQINIPAAADVSVKVSLYDQASQAQAGGTTGLLAVGSYDNTVFLTFQDSYAFTNKANTLVADVASAGAGVVLYGHFEADSTTTPATTTTAGTLNNDLSIQLVDTDAVTGGVQPTRQADGSPMTLAALFDGASKIEVEGNFSAGTAVTLGGANPVPAFAATATKLSWAGAPTGVVAPLVYTVDGTKAIIAGDYKATFTPVSLDATKYTVKPLTATVAGSIRRNGVELQAPLAQVPAGWISRLVLTNTGSTSPKYTIKVLGETGNTITSANTTGSVAPGTNVIELNDVLTAFSDPTKPRGTLVVSVEAKDAPGAGTIQGLYQIVNPTSGSISNHVMVRPGTN